jgi:hypothetical protein
LWQAEDPYLSVLEPGGNVGMVKVKYTGDFKDDGTPVRAVNASDRQIIDIEPNFMGGFNTRLSYKGLDLSVVGTFKNGGILNSMLYGSGSYLNSMNTRSGNNVKVDYWTETNTDAKYPRPNGIGGDNPKYGSTLGYFDATYLKIRTPYTKESGMDPETNSYANENAALPLAGSLKRLLTVGSNTPTTRNYLIGINLTF